MSGNEARTHSLYRKLRQLFDEISLQRDHPLRKHVQRGELIGVVIREHEGYCGIMPRWGNETQKQLIEHFGEKDVAIYAAGLVTKEMRGLVDLITRFDVELAHTEAELMQKDAALAQTIADKDETIDGFVDLLLAITNDKLSTPQFERLSRLVVEKSIVARLEAFEARLAEFEATQSAHRMLELPPPQPQSESNVDGVERRDPS
jgi:hypothetical protein